MHGRPAGPQPPPTASSICARWPPPTAPGPPPRHALRPSPHRAGATPLLLAAPAPAPPPWHPVSRRWIGAGGHRSAAAAVSVVLAPLYFVAETSHQPASAPSPRRTPRGARLVKARGEAREAAIFSYVTPFSLQRA
jgi:hypothetical protein